MSAGTSGGHHPLPQLLPESGYIKSLRLKEYFSLIILCSIGLGKEKDKQGRSYSTKKKKIVASVELTEEGAIKRVYALKIDDYSSKSLSKIFEKHISSDAHISTDKWKGYRPLKKDYNITQSDSNDGQSMPQMHIIIHQIKSWLRTIHSWVHPEHINSYLDEFSFRINRSIYKKTIFHKITERVVQGEHISYKVIIVANK